MFKVDFNLQLAKVSKELSSLDSSMKATAKSGSAHFSEMSKSIIASYKTMGRNIGSTLSSMSVDTAAVARKSSDPFVKMATSISASLNRVKRESNSTFESIAKDAKKASSQFGFSKLTKDISKTFKAVAVIAEAALAGVVTNSEKKADAIGNAFRKNNAGIGRTFNAAARESSLSFNVMLHDAKRVSLEIRKSFASIPAAVAKAFQASSRELAKVLAVMKHDTKAAVDAMVNAFNRMPNGVGKAFNRMGRDVAASFTAMNYDSKHSVVVIKRAFDGLSHSISQSIDRGTTAGTASLSRLAQKARDAAAASMRAFRNANGNNSNGSNRGGGGGGFSMPRLPSFGGGMVGGAFSSVAQGVGQGFGQKLYGLMEAGVKLPGSMVGKWLHDSIELTAVNRKFDIVFAHLKGQASRFSQNLAQEVNGSLVGTKAMMARFQDTLVPMGFSRETSMDMSKKMTRLAIDLSASEPGITESDAAQRLQSAMVGNHEAVRIFGVGLAESTVKMELARLGWSKGYDTASELMKATARLNVIMNGTADAHGAAARASGDYKQQMQGLSAINTEVSAKMGQILAPAAAKVARFFKEIGMELSKSLGPSEQWGMKLGAAMGNIIAKLAPIKDKITELGVGFAYFAESMSNGLLNATSNWSTFKETLRGLFSKASVMLEPFFIEVQSGLLKAFGAIVGGMMGLFGAAEKTIQSVIADILFSISKVVESLEKAMSLFGAMKSVRAYARDTREHGDKGKMIEDTYQKLMVEYNDKSHPSYGARKQDREIQGVSTEQQARKVATNEVTNRLNDIATRWDEFVGDTSTTSGEIAEAAEKMRSAGTKIEAVGDMVIRVGEMGKAGWDAADSGFNKKGKMDAANKAKAESGGVSYDGVTPQVREMQRKESQDKIDEKQKEVDAARSLPANAGIVNTADRQKQPKIKIKGNLNLQNELESQKEWGESREHLGMDVLESMKKKHAKEFSPKTERQKAQENYDSIKAQAGEGKARINADEKRKKILRDIDANERETGSLENQNELATGPDAKRNNAKRAENEATVSRRKQMVEEYEGFKERDARRSEGKVLVRDIKHVKKDKETRGQIKLGGGVYEKNIETAKGDIEGDKLFEEPTTAGSQASKDKLGKMLDGKSYEDRLASLKSRRAGLAFERDSIPRGSSDGDMVAESKLKLKEAISKDPDRIARMARDNAKQESKTNPVVADAPVNMRSLHMDSYKKQKKAERARLRFEKADFKDEDARRNAESKVLGIEAQSTDAKNSYEGMKDKEAPKTELSKLQKGIASKEKTLELTKSAFRRTKFKSPEDRQAAIAKVQGMKDDIQKDKDSEDHSKFQAGLTDEIEKREGGPVKTKPEETKPGGGAVSTGGVAVSAGKMLAGGMSGLIKGMGDVGKEIGKKGIMKGIGGVVGDGAVSLAGKAGSVVGSLSSKIAPHLDKTDEQKRVDAKNAIKKKVDYTTAEDLGKKMQSAIDDQSVAKQQLEAQKKIEEQTAKALEVQEKMPERIGEAISKYLGWGA